MNKIELYIVSIKDLEDEEIYNKAYKTVTEERRRKVDKLKSKNDKLLSVGAEILLQYGLAKKNISIRQCTYKYGINGKPYLDKENERIFFNISHSGKYTICAISDEEIGCDIQKIKDMDLKIAQRNFCEQEYKEIISKTNKKEQQDSFFRYWTLKESFIKTTGLGMKIPLNKFQIIIDDMITVIHSVNKNKYFFKEINNIKNYKCSICSTLYKELQDLKLEKIEISRFLGQMRKNKITLL